MNDILVFVVQSKIFLWLAVAVILFIITAASLLRKRDAIPSTDQKQTVGWQRLFMRLATASFLAALMGTGLVLLFRPSFTSSVAPQQENQRPIDAIYILDISVSMQNYIIHSIPSGDCVDRYGVVRMENGIGRKDCYAITILDRLLARNQNANVAVILFGGTSVIVGPTNDHKSLINAVWFNWEESKSQSLVGATDIKQALVKAWLMLNVEAAQRQKEVPIIMASDFADEDFNAFIELLSSLKAEQANMLAVAIGSPAEYLKSIKEILGESSVFAIENAEDIEKISLILDVRDAEQDNDGADELHLVGGLSKRTAFASAMLVAALAVSIVCVRTIRWPGGVK